MASCGPSGDYSLALKTVQFDAVAARAALHVGVWAGRIRGLLGCAEMAMTGENHPEETTREPVLSPVDRVSEMLFGLFMALTFVGAVSVAEGGREQVREMFI